MAQRLTSRRMAHTHTHDNIDWPTRLTALRRADDLDAEYDRQVADRLVGLAWRRRHAGRSSTSGRVVVA